MKKLILTMGIVSAIFGCMLVGEKDVQAGQEGNPPESIKLDNIFTIPEGSDSSVVEDTNTKHYYVQVTPDRGLHKNGAIWSTPSNELDLTKDFEASMYVYFGGMGSSAADGMAFVMQNSAEQGDTILKGAQGSQMGVWASEEHYGPFNGIQNSFAVEFDAHYNDGFDWDVGKTLGKVNHLAWGYPGKESTYRDEGEGNRVLNHNDVQSIDPLSNDKWYLFNVKWTASAEGKTGTLQYYYGDNRATNPVVTIKDIDLQDVFGGTNVVWGFTGSTGAKTDNNQVAFAKVPGLVNADGTATVSDSSKKVIASQDITGNKVSSGDTLSYKIGANYKDGKQDWEEILANFKLDGDVIYKPGTLKLVKTDQKGTEKSSTLVDSSWTDKTLDKINLGKLGKLSTDANTAAYITFDVTAGAAGMVNQSSGTLKGDNSVVTTNALSYEISPNEAPTLTLADAGKSIDLDNGTDYDFKGTWKDVDSDTASLFYTIDGGDAVSFESDLKNDPKDKDYDYSGTVPTKELAIGTHKVSIYAKDAEGASSNIETVTVNVLGALQFANISKTATYETAKIPTGSDSVVINRGSDWDVSVKDTRAAGSNWHVDLTLTAPFTSEDGHVLKEALMYKSGTNETEFVVGKPMTVYSAATVDNKDVPINWTADQGVLMVAHSSDYRGTYTAGLNWSLVDAP
ncbi:L-type lectin-domain containing protein [Dellaglioa sp. L3N]